MFRIAALNDSDSDDGNTSISQRTTTTKEAKEAEAFGLYSRALGLQREGDVTGAEKTFQSLVSHDFLKDAAQLVDEENDNKVHPGLQLLYSIHKNLAAIAAERGDLHTAMKSYLEAVKIDCTEVTVWYKIGTIGLKIYDFSLARLAFEQGLQCNPNHWPCLDHVITVSYALNDYWRCLYYISKALEKDCQYEKGIALREEMFREQAGLRQDSKHMFEICDPAIFTAMVDKQDAEEYIEEALAMRRKRRELAKKPPRPVIKFPEPIKSNTWKSVGEALVALYDHATSKNPPLSLGQRVDMTEYETKPEDDSKPSNGEGKQTESSEKTPGTENETEMEIGKEGDEVDGKARESEKKPEGDHVTASESEKEGQTTAVSDAEKEGQTTTASDAEKKGQTITVLDSEKEGKMDVAIDVEDKDGQKEVLLEETRELKPGDFSNTQDKDIQALAEVTVNTPVKLDPPARVAEEMEVVEILDEDDEDDVYSISAGLDSSPAPTRPEDTGTDVFVQNQEGKKSEKPETLEAKSPLPLVDSVKEVTSEGTTDALAQHGVEGVPEPVPVSSVVTIHTSDYIPDTKVFQPSFDSKDNLTSSSALPTACLTVPAASQAQDKSSTPIIRGMLGLPLVGSKTEHSPVSAPVQLMSTPKSSLLLCTAAPRDAACFGLPPPDFTAQPAGLLSPVGLGQMTRPASAPSTPDILLHNPLYKSPPTSALESIPKPQSLLSLALNKPTLVSNCPPLMAGGDAPPKSETGILELMLPTSTNPALQIQNLATALPSSVQSIPLQSSVHLQTPSSIPRPAIPQLSPEEKQIIAQHAAAQTLMALAQMPAKLSPSQTSGTTLPPTSLAGLMVGGLLATQQERKLNPLSYALSPEVALQDHPRTFPRELIRGHGGSRRGAKRKRVSLPMEDAGMKRRSTRVSVRNTSRKKQEDSINMQELLYKFLPSTLIQPSDEEEDSHMEDSEAMMSDVEVTKSVNNTNLLPADAASLKVTEEKEVKDFVQKCVKNYGIIDLMFRFLTTLTDKYNMKWPEGLAEVFVQVYDKLRRHLTFPCVFGGGNGMDEEDILEYGRISLQWAELKLDEWLSTHGRPTGTPSRSGIHAVLGEAPAANDYPREDLWYITMVAANRGQLQDQWYEFAARVYWLKGRLSMLENDKDEADFCFEKLSVLMDISKEEKDISCFKLQNCKNDDIISKEQMASQQESLQRSQSLEETQKLYEAGNYDKVVELLLQTFSLPQSAKKLSEAGSSLPERHSQLTLLQDSLFKLKDYKKCLLWGEVSFNEALQQYRRAHGQQRDDWLATITKIFKQINKVLNKDDEILKNLPSTNTVRLSQNLIRMIEFAMDSMDSSSEVPNSVVQAWILLSRLIKSEEGKFRSMLLSDEEQMEGAISSSLMLLNVAHEYLGRHSWCTKSDGALLLYFVDELKGEMKKPHFVKEGLDMALEQCIYCLYGYPNKKGKARHLQDHNVTQISLDWDKASIVFDYFKPLSVPEFDSYKAITVSAELESLLRRLYTLVPSQMSKAEHYDSVQNYIEGSTNSPPANQTASSILKELYYLMADYYFKNKETAKAIKFYTYDLSVNPGRLDSWAGLALARMLQLEQKLSSMELKMESPIHKKSIPALRCFRRAVEIDETQKKLWIEYGSLAYQLHSHASRQLKMQEWFPLNEDLLGIVQDTKQEMLQVAHNCYWKASECEADGNEEEWLHHYMIAKVKEKKRLHPKDYLEHYRQAAIYLHEDEALYPKKIIFASSPPKLALEALEVFYRLHVAILKQLLKKDGLVDYKLFQDYLSEAAESPFAKGREKKHERRESHSTSHDESSSSNLTPPAYSQFKAKPVFHMTPQDHTYSKQKSSVDGSDNSSDLLKEGQESSGSQSKPGQDQENKNKKPKSPDPKKDESKSSNIKTLEAMEVSEDVSAGPLKRHESTGFNIEIIQEVSLPAEPKPSEPIAGGPEAASKTDVVQEETAKAELPRNQSDAIKEPVEAEKISSGSDAPESELKASAGASSPKKDVSSSSVEIIEVDEVKDSESKTTDVDMNIDGENAKDSGSKTTDVGPKTDGENAKSEDSSLLILDPETGLMVPATDIQKMEMEDSPPPLLLPEEPVPPERRSTPELPLKSMDSDPAPDLGSPVKDIAPVPELDKPKKSDSDKPKEPDSDIIEISDSDDDDDVATATKPASPVKPKEPEIQNSEKASSAEKSKTETSGGSSQDVKTGESTENKTDATKDNEDDDEEDDDDDDDEDSSSSEYSDDSDSFQQNSMDREILHTELIDKCIDALTLCIQRFPNHYKSLYRLAHVYMTSPYHKNLEYARDLLLGKSNWQDLSHMPGPGLFVERRSTNFFQGIWKLPTVEIDRSGSFASHIHRSVRLLIEVLKEKKDIYMLLHLHIQLNRSPDTGKKYLRDQERNMFARMAFKAILEAANEELSTLQKGKSHDKQLDFLMCAYRVWYHASHKLNAFVEQCAETLTKVFKIAQKDNIDPTHPVLDQAIKFCQHRAAALKPSHQSGDHNKSANTSSTSFMSPTSAKSYYSDVTGSQNEGSTKPSIPTSLFSPPYKKSLHVPVSSSASPVARNSNQLEISKPSGNQSGSSSQQASQPVVTSSSANQSESRKVCTSQSDASSADQSDEGLKSPSADTLTSQVKSWMSTSKESLIADAAFIDLAPSITQPQDRRPNPVTISGSSYIEPDSDNGSLRNSISAFQRGIFESKASSSCCSNSDVLSGGTSEARSVPKYSFASSINLKSLADGMKKKFESALLSNPRFQPSRNQGFSDSTYKIFPEQQSSSGRGMCLESSQSSRVSEFTSMVNETPSTSIEDNYSESSNSLLKRQTLVSLLNKKVDAFGTTESARPMMKEPLEQNVFAESDRKSSNMKSPVFLNADDNIQCPREGQDPRISASQQQYGFGHLKISEAHQQSDVQQQRVHDRDVHVSRPNRVESLLSTQPPFAGDSSLFIGGDKRSPEQFISDGHLHSLPDKTDIFDLESVIPTLTVRAGPSNIMKGDVDKVDILGHDGRTLEGKDLRCHCQGQTSNDWRPYKQGSPDTARRVYNESGLVQEYSSFELAGTHEELSGGQSLHVTGYAKNMSRGFESPVHPVELPLSTPAGQLTPEQLTSRASIYDFISDDDSEEEVLTIDLDV